jgi:hypothetical protein
MPEYSNENRGVLFKNDRKDSDKHPDYRGSINVNGIEYWLSAWIREGQKGKFMSLSVQPKDEVRHHEDRKNPGPPMKNEYAQAAQSSRGSSVADMSDDCPF